MPRWNQKKKHNQQKPNEALITSRCRLFGERWAKCDHNYFVRLILSICLVAKWIHCWAHTHTHTGIQTAAGLPKTEKKTQIPNRSKRTESHWTQHKIDFTSIWYAGYKNATYHRHNDEQHKRKTKIEWKSYCLSRNSFGLAVCVCCVCVCVFVYVAVSVSVWQKLSKTFFVKHFRLVVRSLSLFLFISTVHVKIFRSVRWAIEYGLPCLLFDNSTYMMVWYGLCCVGVCLHHWIWRCISNVCSFILYGSLIHASAIQYNYHTHTRQLVY